MWIRQRFLEGLSPRTVKDKCKKMFGLSIRQTRRLITEAELDFTEEFVRSYKHDYNYMLNQEMTLLKKLKSDLDGIEESVKSKTELGDGGVDLKGKKIEGDRKVTNEVFKKKIKGRTGIYAEWGKCLNRIADLKGLNQKEVAKTAESPEVVSIKIGEVTEELEDTEIDAISN